MSKQTYMTVAEMPKHNALSYWLPPRSRRLLKDRRLCRDYKTYFSRVSIVCQAWSALKISRLKFTFFLLILCTIFPGSETQVINLRQGNVQGVAQESGNRMIYAYMGIPYAKPPIGELRFKPPEPHSGWTQTLYADSFKAACPQPFLRRVQTSEDCLTLNVWIPEPPSMTRRFPVIVLLEGELFVTSSPSRFPGLDLAAADLIVVTLNYRTNAFGFLTWEDQTLPGNLGLRDQLLALRWVKENIERFGGDLNKITLLGHSAGAASAAFHLVSPASHGLFQRLILMSGSHLAPWAINRRPKEATKRLAVQLGCKVDQPTSYIADCLKRPEMNRIVAAVEKMIEEGNPYYIFGPVVDSYLNYDQRMVPVEPKESLHQNGDKKVEILAGISEDDGSVLLYIKREINYMAQDDLIRYGREILVPLVTTLCNLGGRNIKTVNKVVEYNYLDKASKGDRKGLIMETIRMFSDSFFKAPIIELLNAVSMAGMTTFFYVNSFVAPDIYESPANVTGSLHGSELVYLFGPSSYRQHFSRSMNLDEQQMSERFKRMVFTFASKAQPWLGVYTPRWSRYTRDAPIYAQLESGMLHSGYQKYQIDFWENFLPSISKLPSYTTIQSTTDSGGTLTYSSRPSTETQIITGEDMASYQSLMWVLIALIILLLLSILIYIYFIRRRRTLSSSSFFDE